MTDRERILLTAVRTVCAEKPEFLESVILVGTAGITDYADKCAQKASDMETFASAMCFLAGQKRVTVKLKEQMSNLALCFLEKHYKKDCSLNWKSNIQEGFGLTQDAKETEATDDQATEDAKGVQSRGHRGKRAPRRRLGDRARHYNPGRVRLQRGPVVLQAGRQGQAYSACGDAG